MWVTRKESHPQIRFSLSYRHVRHFIDKTLLWGNTDVMIAVVSFFIHDFDNERWRQKLWMMVDNVTRSRYRRASQYVFRLNAWRRIDLSIVRMSYILRNVMNLLELVLKGSDNVQLCRVNKEVSCSIVKNVCNSLEFRWAHIFCLEIYTGKFHFDTVLTLMRE